MAFKINADRYAYSAEPEKVSGSYAAELAKKLSAEEAEVRQREDAALKNEIDIAVAEERGVRTESDRALDERISLEVSRRVAGDEDLDSRLSDEVSARLALERSLQGRISEEVQARSTADADIRADMAAESERVSGRLDNSEALINSLAASKADKSHTHSVGDIRDGSEDLGDIIFSVTESVDSLWADKADNTVTVELTDNMGIESVTETDTVANILQKAYSETRLHSVLFNQDMYPMISDLQSNKISKTQIFTYDSSAFTFRFENTHNREYRLAEVSNISFTFGDGEYELDYTSGLSFDSGATPTAIDYTDSGILNWVGTDCTNVNGLSIFQPSANTHYDIVFYFNGRQFIGLVNGFVSSIEWQGALPTGNEAV